jgi:hypothetical protein
MVQTLVNRNALCQNSLTAGEMSNSPGPGPRTNTHKAAGLAGTVTVPAPPEPWCSAGGWAA